MNGLIGFKTSAAEEPHRTKTVLGSFHELRLSGDALNLPLTHPTATARPPKVASRVPRYTRHATRRTRPAQSPDETTGTPASFVRD